jgi:enterochelin esterase-like enzyme
MNTRRRLTMAIALSPGLFAFASASKAQDAAPVSAGQARANFARTIVLAPDDQRAFAAAPPGFADARPGVAPGRIDSFAYTSAETGTRRLANVYLPPGFSSERKYPVLYLLHGLGGNHEEWRGYIRAHTILDNLMADGKVVPMIVVMPNGRALPDDRPPPQDRMFTPDHVAGFARFERDLLGSLIPAVEAAYPVQRDARQRAIAGLSMGGGQALNFGLAHLDTFASVGGFSSAPNTRPPAQLLPDPAAARRQLALLYLSCGRQDGLINVSQGVHRYLKQHDVPHAWNVDEYGHDRDSWADNLYHFAQRLFR